MKRILLLFSVLMTGTVSAQLLVNNSVQTPADLVQNVLLGPGVTVSNITFNGSVANANTVTQQAGTFDGTNANIGLLSGIILATGNAQLAVGPNNQGGATLGGSFANSADPDLNIIAGVGTNDKAVLEFDFIPVGDTIRFRFVFGSEEYLEYVNSINDAFGFFLSGPGISGTYSNNAINIALLPNSSTPITINSVNNVMNSSYYIDNGTGTSPPQNTDPEAVQYDGFTVVLEAKSYVQCGQTYHIKIAVADAADAILDSGVFLEAGSLSSDGVDVDLTTLTGSDTIIEGCNNGATFIFTRTNVSGTYTVHYDITGNATNGVDYNYILDSIVFAVGADSALLNITALADLISNENDSLVITVFTITSCGDTIINSATLYLIDPPVLYATANPTTFIACPRNVVVFDGSAAGGTPPYSFYWSFGANTAIATDTIETYQVVTLDVTDACGETAQATITPEGCPIVIPNIFTPNGDGANDNFEIQYLETHPNSILTVYNRWGNVVYESSNYLNNWNGDKCADGVYFYILQLTDETEPSDYKGFVHMHRIKN